MEKGIWLRTDELSESLEALKIVLNFLREVQRDTYHWKWVIISLHNSLQGFMVCALKGSNNLNVLKPKVAEEWLKAYQSNSGDYPVEILDTFLNLYEKIKSGKMLMFVHSKKFSPKGKQDWSVKKLNRLRNKFIHFIPQGWSLEVGGLPQITKDCIEIIKFLAFESNNLLWTKNSLQNDLSKLIERIDIELNKLMTGYKQANTFKG